jgi:hypothetical protein
VAASWKQGRDEVIDVGAYRRLEVQFRLLKAGTAGTAWLETAPVDEDEAFQQVGAAVNLNGSGMTNNKQQISSDAFYRFARVVTDGAVAGSPVLTVDVVAKE